MSVHRMLQAGFAALIMCAYVLSAGTGAKAATLLVSKPEQPEMSAGHSGAPRIWLAQSTTAGVAPDEKLWLTIKNLPIPGLLEKFIERYPDSRYRADAEERLKALNSGDTKSKQQEADTLLATGKSRSGPATGTEPKTLTRNTNPAAADFDTNQPSDLVVAIQTELDRVGCHSAAIDGYWGPLTKASVERFGKAAKRDFDLQQPSPELLDAARTAKVPACKIASISPQVPSTAATPTPRTKPAVIKRKAERSKAAKRKAERKRAGKRKAERSKASKRKLAKRTTAKRKTVKRRTVKRASRKSTKVTKRRTLKRKSARRTAAKNRKRKARTKAIRRKQVHTTKRRTARKKVRVSSRRQTGGRNYNRKIAPGKRITRVPSSQSTHSAQPAPASPRKQVATGGGGGGAGGGSGGGGGGGGGSGGGGSGGW